MTNLPKKFELYLTETLSVSRKTLRNYRADLSHFFGWTTLHLKTRGVNIENPNGIVLHLSAQLVAEYKGYHLENRIPEGTTNRRLSTLRNFSRFLLLEGILSEDPTKVISNIKRELEDGEKIGLLVNEFKKHLQKDGVSKITLKNYISDIRHFLSWNLKIET